MNTKKGIFPLKLKPPAIGDRVMAIATITGSGEQVTYGCLGHIDKHKYSIEKECMVYYISWDNWYVSSIRESEIFDKIIVV